METVNMKPDSTSLTYLCGYKQLGDVAGTFWFSEETGQLFLCIQRKWARSPQYIKVDPTPEMIDLIMNRIADKR